MQIQIPGGQGCENMSLVKPAYPTSHLYKYHHQYTHIDMIEIGKKWGGAASHWVNIAEYSTCKWCWFTGKSDCYRWGYFNSDASFPGCNEGIAVINTHTLIFLWIIGILLCFPYILNYPKFCLNHFPSAYFFALSHADFPGVPVDWGIEKPGRWRVKCSVIKILEENLYAVHWRPAPEADYSGPEKIFFL